MTLHQLKVFATVVKLGSFTEATKTLHISQPSVSALVTDLRDELAAPLFERLGNKRQLTEAGKRLYERAESGIATIEGIREEIEELQGLKKGKICVGGSALAAAILPSAIEGFKKEHPGVEVILSTQRSDGLEKKLLEGEIDVAIMGWAPSSSLLVGERYIEEEVVAIARQNHPLTRKRSVPLELLVKEPLITTEKGIPVRDMIERRFTERGLPFVPRLEVDSQFSARDTIRNAVAGGLGIGFVAKCHVVSDIEAGRIKVLKVPELNLKRTMYIAVHKKRESSSLVQAFIERLRHYKEQ
jgi:DNA-binding transcriptional LysR family regulator